jgi:hypothetical protein
LSILGVAFIIIYGLSDLEFHNKESAEVFIAIESFPKGARKGQDMENFHIVG